MRLAIVAILRHHAPLTFPPPIRIAAPLLALAVGLAATFFEYRLNLDLDLDRHLAEVRQRADSNGLRLARLSEFLLPMGQTEALAADLKAMNEMPQLNLAGVVDDHGLVIADSTGTLHGEPVAKTPLEDASMLITPAGQKKCTHSEDSHLVLSAHPFHLGTGATGWVLMQFDRAEAVAATEADARTQLVWMASAMALLSFLLWAVLHFGFAARLGRLADSVRAFGSDDAQVPLLPGGGDEVGRVSAAFMDLGRRLRERKVEQIRLEREVLEISETERTRIGHDLHDCIGQRLTAVSMATNAAVAELEKNAPEHAGRIADIGRQLREAIGETRALSHGLAPIDLSGDGLMEALCLLATDTASCTGLRCVFDCPEPVRVPDAALAVQLYRVAQEAVNNALRHAEPTEIRIALEQHDGDLLLEVEDDGVGLPETLAAVGGIGLRLMRHRIELAGGTFEFGSAPAGGTRIVCHVKHSV